MILFEVVKAGVAGSPVPDNGLGLVNTTLSTTGVQIQASPSLLWQGYGWNTTGMGSSSTFGFAAYAFPTASGSPGGSLVIASQIAGGTLTRNLTVSTPGVSGVTGLGITSGANGLALVVTGPPSTNEALTIDAAVGGNLTLNGTATGLVQIGHGLQVLSGGITLAPTGTITGTNGASGTAGTAVSLIAGNGGATSGAGGDASLTGGAATAGNSVGGAANVTGGAGSGTSAGGAIVITSGAGGANGAGGAISLSAGAGGSSAGAGGAVSVTGGAGTFNPSIGGAVTGGVGVGSSSGGQASLVGGQAGATGVGGAIAVTGRWRDFGDRWRREYHGWRRDEW